jgi:hypothetical protein
MNYRIHYSDELYHYGVKGMKWGVRKEYVPKGRKKASGDQTTEKNRGLSRGAKIAIGAATAAAIIGGSYYLYKTGKFDKLAEIGKSAVDSQFGGASTKVNISKLGKDVSAVHANTGMIRSINATNSGPGAKMNCFHTSTSYILNSLFGQKTTAKPYSGFDEISGMQTARDWKLFNSIFDGIKTKDYLAEGGKSVNLSQAVNDIKRGSSGVIHFEGHFMNYEMSGRGRLTLIDAQREGNQIIEVTGDVLRKIGDGYKIQRILDFSEASIREDSTNILTHIINR